MTPEDLKELLDKIGVEGIVQRNNNWQALCPFHQETRPSWGISFDPPHFHGCFGCGAKGSLSDLLVRVGRWSTAKARRFVGLTSRTFPALTMPQTRKLKLVDETELYPLKLSKAAKRYALSRGLSEATITELGLLHEPEMDRLLFPWYFDDKLIGVTGRALNPDDPVKTLPLYGTQKGQCFYLPNRSLDSSQPLIVVEGETDAARVYDAGFKNVGALCFGTLSRQQLSFALNSGLRELVLFLDDDERGRELSQELSTDLRTKFSLSKVEWKSVRRKYAELTGGKLDPACLSRADIRELLKNHVSRNAAWPIFKLGEGANIR